MPVIDIDEIVELAEEDWSEKTTARAEILLNGVLGWISSNAPCLDNLPVPAIADQAKMIISEAILRAVSGGYGNVASDSTGPDSVSYIDRSSKPTLTEGDKAALRALCPVRRRQRYGTIRTKPAY